MSGGRATYLAALASALDLPAERFDAPGSSVVGGDDRRGQRRVSHYRLGVHDVLWIDPDLTGELADLDGSDEPLGFSEFRARASTAGAEFVGGGYEHVLAGPRADHVELAGVARLDQRASATRAAAAALLDGCDPAERDAAEFDLDDLDPFLAGWERDGQLLGLAGARPNPFRPGFVEIGVIVHPAARRVGVGRAVVSTVANAVVDSGAPPLYCCPRDNEASRRLCRSIGFEQVGELEAFRWPSPA